MTTPNPDTLCPGCFADKGQTNPCPHCGYDEQAGRGPLPLPHRTLLQGQFVVGRVLGKPGGFGITYLGWDLHLQTRVAIKEYLPRELAGRSSDRASVAVHSQDEGEQFRYGLEQFLREARTLARLDHPNIVRVRHFFEANGTAYLVMDYYQGLSLAEYLEQKNGRLAEETARQLMLPILDGLRAAHAKNILHRDIKPQNLYLARLESGGVRPILLDFGAARQAMGEHSRSLSVVLTPGYAPFEQYHRRGKQGPWTDIYAAAAVLYRLVTGETPPEATERQAQDELRPATDFGVSQRLSDVLAAGLAMDPKFRPQSIHAFQTLLLTLASPPTAQPELARKGGTDPTQAPKRPSSNLQLAFVTGLLWLGLGGSYLYFQAEDKRQEIFEATQNPAVEATRLAEVARESEAATRGAADERAYLLAAGADTESAYRMYLDQCAADGCGHRVEAEGRLAGLASERQRQADQDAFKKAESTGTAESYRAYLANCTVTGCVHRRKAEAGLERLARKETITLPDLVRIPAGSFMMGSPASEPQRESDEGPRHLVNVAAFELGKTEVTFHEWDACVAAGGCQHKPDDAGWGRGQRPVINVSWNDAQTYVAWLRRETGESWRLPTEAEWEYATRAGTTTTFFTGACIMTSQANYDGTFSDYNNCGAKTGVNLGMTQPVKSYPANPWGLYDLLGNVWEWVEDCYEDSFHGAPTDGSAWTQDSCLRRVLRGGSWNGIPWNMRSAGRNQFDPGTRLSNYGFRVARGLTP